MLTRIVLALSAPTLQRELRKHLVSDDVTVDVVRNSERLWRQLTRADYDVAVLSASLMPQPSEEYIAALADAPDTPSLVVVADAIVAETRARMLAAGCEMVLDSATPMPVIAQAVSTLLERQRELATRELLAGQLRTRPRLADFVSESPTMGNFMRTVDRVVRRDASLLILGETGVGKERLAQAIHNDGPRAAGPFMAINCGALPETLLESELFGHEEGAFTGATRSRRGCFELAHGGTLFLDEIADVPHHLQVKLLRALQEREVRRLGAEAPIHVDVRVVAATNRDLEDAVEQGTFRRDLFYRLSVVTLQIPPLRERREDIPTLAQSYLRYLQPRIGVEVFGMRDDVLHALTAYAWPGNVRELINVVERALLLCDGDEITLDDLPEGISGHRAAIALGATLAFDDDRAHVSSPADGVRLPAAWLELPWRDVRKEAIARLERAYLRALLDDTSGRVGQTARRAGMTARSLFHKMQQHRLRKEDYRRKKTGS